MEQPSTRDSRSVLMLFFPVGLLFLSLVILFALGFRFYYKGDTNLPVAEKKAAAVTPASVAADTRDSLQRIYRATITELDNRLDSIWNNADTLSGNLQVKLNEFYRLRKEITGLLKNGSSTADLTLASEKINDLQRKIIELTRRKEDVENENKRLNEMIAQLRNSAANTELVAVKTKATETKPAAEHTVSPAPLQTNFTASEIQLTAVKLADEKEEETTDAEKAEKLVASFALKNNYNQYNNTEVEVVVVQPDGEVLQPSAWESGTFSTAEGKKIYSGKMRFEYLKGENKRLRLSLSADKFQQGNYILQLYHNGKMIGRTVKQLG